MERLVEYLRDVRMSVQQHFILDRKKRMKLAQIFFQTQNVLLIIRVRKHFEQNVPG